MGDTNALSEFLNDLEQKANALPWSSWEAVPPVDADENWQVEGPDGLLIADCWPAIDGRGRHGAEGEKIAQHIAALDRETALALVAVVRAAQKFSKAYESGADGPAMFAAAEAQSEALSRLEKRNAP